MRKKHPVSKSIKFNHNVLPIIGWLPPSLVVFCGRRGYCKVLSQPVMREFEFMAGSTVQEKYFQNIDFEESHPPEKRNSETEKRNSERKREIVKQRREK